MEGPGNSAPADIRTIVEDMDFLDLSKLLEGLAQTKVPKKKVEHLTRYFNHFRESFKTNYKNLDPAKSNNDSIFSVARIFLPTEDRKRPAYNFKGHTLARVFARTLGLDKNSVDGKRLLEYKNPEMSPAAGNLGNVVFSVMTTRSGNALKSPSIAELHNVLDQLAKSPENNINLEGQRKILQTFIPRLTPLEGKWLTRILLKHLSLGLTIKQIFACIHPQAQELYERTGNLETVCIQLNDLNVQINEKSLQLFQPFKPMLCARLNSLGGTPKPKSSRAEPATLPAPPFLLETKWDGERFQIHYDSAQPPNNRWRYFSRNGFDFTSNFNLTLTPRLAKCLKPSESFILDGEMMAWKKSTGTFTQKGANIDVKKMRADNPNHCPAFVAYDIVYFNGESLLNRSLNFRMNILMKDKLIAEPQDGAFYLSKQKVVQSKKEVMEALNEAVDNLQEGLVVKDLQSFYEIGKRQNSWLKIKPEFFSEYSLDDLDLIILGGYYTESVRKAATISHFLVGLLDNSELGKEKFYPVARVGSGRLRLLEMDKLLRDLEPHFTREEDPSSNVLFQGRKRPDFFINPKKSVVVQVKATEILYHDSYALKYTLRFPRIVLVRRDKSWQDILTLKEFHDIRVTSGGKFAKRNDDVSPGRITKPLAFRGIPRICKNQNPQNIEDTPEKPEKSISKVSATSKYFTISNSYKTRTTRPATSDTVCKSGRKAKILRDVFKSRVFCVIGSSDWKSTMEDKIIQNGGEIVQNPTSDMFAIVAENVSAKVDKFIQKGQYDVLQGSWILKCIESEQISKMLPDDIFAAKPETREELDKDFDIFGDSYCEKKSSFDTKKLLEKIMAEEPDQESDSGLDDTINEAPKVPLKKRVLEELEPTDADKIRKFNFLEDCKIAFRGEICRQDHFMWEQNILFYGGHCAEHEGEDGVTHVLAWDQNSSSKRKQLSAFVVKPKWLLDCLDRRKLLDELNYMSD